MLVAPPWYQIVDSQRVRYVASLRGEVQCRQRSGARHPAESLSPGILAEAEPHGSVCSTAAIPGGGGGHGDGGLHPGTIHSDDIRLLVADVHDAVGRCCQSGYVSSIGELGLTDELARFGYHRVGIVSVALPVHVHIPVPGGVHVRDPLPTASQCVDGETAYGSRISSGSSRASHHACCGHPDATRCCDGFADHGEFTPVVDVCTRV